MSDKKTYTIEIPDNVSKEDAAKIIQNLIDQHVGVKPTTNPRINITAILDRSGSMQSIINDSIGGFNTFLKEQQESKDGDAWMSIQLFDDQHTELESLKPINQIKPLHAGNYVPRGMTSLYDAIGKALTKLKADNHENNIIVILTDGGENSSREFNQSTIKSMITEAEAKGWKFIYLGANQDAFEVSRGLGIMQGSASNFVANSAGTTTAYADIGTFTKAYRSAYVSKTDLDSSK
jgi:uncharacterized protein with von Willebrand factor type A (vWA) domain